MAGENPRQNEKSAAKLRPAVQVKLVKDSVFFGPGAAELLSFIDQTGSIQEACNEMELSYSKGSRLIKNVERQLGYRLVERWTGGTGGGGSRLTVEGRRLVASYERLVAEVQRAAEDLFEDCFGDNTGEQ